MDSAKALLAKALLIDLDGTLVDTLPDFVAATGELAQALAVPRPTADQVRALIGRGGERLVRDLLALWAADASAFDAAWALYQRHYAAHNGRHARVFAGAAEALAALGGQGWRLACVTNKPQAMAEELLTQTGLRPAFDTVVGSVPGRRAKPNPDALLAACEHLGLAAHETLMVGDSRNDAEAARAAGCSGVLLLRHGYNHGEPIDATPAAAHLADWPALQNWFSGRPCPATGT